MKVLFLPTNCTGVNFWRMYQFYSCMKQKGVDAVIYNYHENQNLIGEWENRFQADNKIRGDIYKFIKYSDITVLQYVHIPLMLALIGVAQETLNTKVITEIDDYVQETPNYNPAFTSGFKPGNVHSQTIIEAMKMSNGVITSTDYLKKEFIRRGYNKKIALMPNCINFKVWDKAVKFKRNKLRIGWVGGANHEEDLRIMLLVIPEILKRYKDVEFYFGHGVPNYLKDFSRVKWSVGWTTISKYQDYLGSCGIDIALAPLDINMFNMGKSNLRWLEYSALKIPTVATDIEPYSKSVKNGITGYLCKSSNDWIEAISTLIENEKLRVKIGENAYDEVHKKYNLDTVTDKYIKVLKSY